MLGLVLGGWVVLRLALAGLAMTAATDSAFHAAPGRQSMLAARLGNASQSGDSTMRPARRNAGFSSSARATRRDVIAVSAVAADRDGFGVRPSGRQPSLCSPRSTAAAFRSRANDGCFPAGLTAQPWRCGIRPPRLGSGAMDVYLPIANLAVNGLVIVGLGALTGLLSGMFGVGGGFLTTPLLIFYGVPPTVAAASAASQVTGASVSGAFAHARRGGIDYHMGAVLVAGGVLGTGIGALLFRLLQALGQIDTVINILYVLLLGGIGGLMAHESITALRAQRRGLAQPARRRRHHPLVASLPLRWRFYRSGLYLAAGAAPAGHGHGHSHHADGYRRRVHPGAGDALYPGHEHQRGGRHLAVPDPVRDHGHHDDARADHACGRYRAGRAAAGRLGLGRADRGAVRAKAKPEQLRLILALIVLGVALRMALGLGYRPDEIFTVVPL
jgi:uncharacterized membrane protein YfcA